MIEDQNDEPNALTAEAQNKVEETDQGVEPENQFAEEEDHGPGPLVQFQQPVNMDKPTKLELEATESLIKFLEKQDCFESEERSQKRREVLEELQQITNEFVRLAAIEKKLEPEIDGKPVQCKLFPFGSYRLGVCGTTSDIDCLCVTPKFVNRNNFFKILGDLLHKNPKASGIQKIENAFVPIITMEFDTVEVDISFASLDLPTIPDDVDLSNDEMLNSLDTKAASSINGVRTNDMILQLIPNLDNFRVLLRFIRVWSKKRAIYGNVNGYLGGINLALLAVFTCQRYPVATPSTLVLMFFSDLMDWDWPNPIYINTPNVGPLESWSAETSQDVMPIITPAYPCINSLRSASISTRHRMTEEFKLGYKLTVNIITKGKKWKKLIADTNFFTSYKFYIRIEIAADTEDNFWAWEGTVNSKIKRLALDLEKEENIQYAVTFPKIFEHHDEANGKYAGSFFIGMIFKKPSDPSVKINIDVTPLLKSFLSLLMKLDEKKASMLINPAIIRREDVPLFVFPDGKRPEIKKPKAKKSKKEK